MIKQQESARQMTDKELYESHRKLWYRNKELEEELSRYKLQAIVDREIINSVNDMNKMLEAEKVELIEKCRAEYIRGRQDGYKDCIDENYEDDEDY